MKYTKINIEDYLDTSKIKDPNSDDGFSLGIYDDKVGINGFYLKAEKDSLLERIEKMAKSKFQLENDSENYMQEARVELWLSIIKYYDKFGYDEDIKPDGWIYQDLKYKLMDMAKLAKGNVSVCDRKTGKYHINKLESFEKKFIEEIDKVKNQKDERFLCEVYNSEKSNETTNEFIKWFNDNKEFILTNKQLGYLDGTTIIHGSSSIWRINKNIAKRVEEAYTNNRIKKEKTKVLQKQLKYITYLLDFKDEDDLLNRLIKMSEMKNDTVIIEIYEDISMESCSKLTDVLVNNKKAYGNKFFYEIISSLSNKEIYINGLINKINDEGNDINWD